MNNYFESTILEATGATAIVSADLIQNLWSDYGKLMRVNLQGAEMESVVVKHVQLPKSSDHPRGWNTEIGHQRKILSYRIESHWYASYSDIGNARLPKCYASVKREDEVIIVLEDLDAQDFTLRKETVTWDDVSICLEWLAKFHVSYLDHSAEGLWPIGTYWHLDTRPQELAELKDQRLREAARGIDMRLNECKYQTLVHGDAKLANFCFSNDGKVAGVDFQYVGGGCGMKDVAYFIGSCMKEDECDILERKILDTYFRFLQAELSEPNTELEEEWRSMYRVAWADFHRFIKGWSPDHWKITDYSTRITNEVISSL